MLRGRWLTPIALVLASLVCLMGAVPAAADPAFDDRVAAGLQAEPITPKPAPARFHLGQLKHSVQTLNNCGPASTVSAMSHYDINVSQEEARKVLRPYSESRGMSARVIPDYVTKFGLRARVLENGTRDIIKTLVANNIPVIVGQWISESERIGHYRVVQGYDDAKGVFYINDSLLGPNITITYASFDARWTYRRAQYVPIYPPDWADLVNAIVRPPIVIKPQPSDRGWVGVPLAPAPFGK